MKTGDMISTPFGQGLLQECRETDRVYVVELPYATLYAGSDWISQNTNLKAELCSAAAKNAIHKVELATRAEQVNPMELNEAYEALEKMRKLNLELTCRDKGIPATCLDCIDLDQYCTLCLLTTPTDTLVAETAAAAASNPTSETPELGALKGLPRLQGFMKGGINRITNSSIKAVRIAKTPFLKRQPALKTKPCLTCASPVCAKHSSPSFRKENISVCKECERFFTLEFVVGCLTAESPAQRRKEIDHMVDLYDRTMLLLKYSARFIPELCDELEERTAKTNRVQLGSSSAGIVSGALGVAAAATIFTPAGPPLLIASLLFGGSATAVQTSSDVINQNAEANRLADRILALNGMVAAILRTIGTLRDALTREHIRIDAFPVERRSVDDNDQFSETDLVKEALDRHKGQVLLATTSVGCYGLATLEMSNFALTAERGIMAGRTSRIASTALRTARLARFAGGALSAACLVLETRVLANTVAEIKAGNPCDKARELLTILTELDILPNSKSLDDECQRYVQAMEQRLRKLTEEEAVRLLLEHQEEILKDQQSKGQQQLKVGTHDKDLDETLVLSEYDEPVATMLTSEESFSGGDDEYYAIIAETASGNEDYRLEQIDRHKQQDCSNKFSKNQDEMSPPLVFQDFPCRPCKEECSSPDSIAMQQNQVRILSYGSDGGSPSNMSASLLERIELHKKKHRMAATPSP